jgi:RND family efflux transporter MFP subunit
MHPTYRSEKPGNCPICSMRLVPLSSGEGSSQRNPSFPEPPGSATQSPAAPAQETSRGPSAIQISPERQQEIGLRFAEATRGPATVTIRAVGRVAPDERRLAHVHSKVAGWIEDVFVDFVGASVRKGQPLFTIYSPDLVAGQEEYLLALKAERELGESAQPGVAQGAKATAIAARQRLAFWDLTQGQIDELERSGQVARTVTVQSPVSGVVTERSAYHHGRTVTPEMDLYTIVDLGRVWILADVYENEIGLVALGQTARVVQPSEPGDTALTGTVAFIAPTVDPKARTIEVRTEFENRAGRLRPEAFVDVIFEHALGEQIVVPATAVMETGTSQYVFVDGGEGYLEPRGVQAGPEAEQGRVINAGLKAGERVVTSANFVVDSESRLKGALDAMGRPSGVPSLGAPSGAVLVTLKTSPSPAKTGENSLRANVADAAGHPVTDAQVEVRLSMPQMGSMPAMEAKATLFEVAPGEYAGQVNIPIAWTWETTVTVRRTGRLIGTTQTSITAR